MMGNKTVFQQKLEELKRAGEEKKAARIAGQISEP